MDGYKLFRRDRQGRRGSRVALCIRECFDCLELDDGDNRAECLWVRIRGRANKADIMVGCCYRPPNQDEEVDEIFYKQLRKDPQLLAIVLVGDWLTGEVPVDWRLASVTPVWKKGWKEDPGNYRLVSLTLVPGKVMEQILS